MNQCPTNRPSSSQGTGSTPPGRQTRGNFSGKKGVLARLRPGDLLRMAGGSLRSNKLRTGLTILGITIGVFSVVSVMTALSAIRGAIDSGLSQLGAGVFEISRFPGLMITENWWDYRHRQPIRYRQAQRLQDILAGYDLPMTMHIADNSVRGSYEDRRTTRNLRLVGVNEHYLTTHNHQISFGRNITPEDLEFNRPVTVIGHALLESLFPNENPLGKMITLARARYEVVGVLERKGEAFGQSFDDLALIPVPRFLQRHTRRWSSMDLAVQATDIEAFEETQDVAIGAMRLVRGLEPEQPNDFDVYSNDSLRETFARTAFLVGVGGLIISVIALVTAGVGIMNIMLVSVTERTREIGIRKSLGARAVDVLRQFLLEAFLLAQTGGVFGILLGALAGNAVALYLNVPPIVPWEWALIAVVVCTVIGLGFGSYPAWKAARLQPVEALRFE